MAEFIERKRRLNAFDIRYNDTIDAREAGGAGGTSDERWQRCANVLSRRDMIKWLSKGW
jgi:hypothetical protein